MSLLRAYLRRCVPFTILVLSFLASASCERLTIDESRLVGSYASGDSPPIALDLLPGGVFVERIDGRQVKCYWQTWTLECGNWSDSRDRYSIELAGLVLSVY